MVKFFDRMENKQLEKKVWLKKVIVKKPLKKSESHYLRENISKKKEEEERRGCWAQVRAERKRKGINEKRIETPFFSWRLGRI